MVYELFRNRFVVKLSGTQDPPGFIFDYHKLPPIEVDNGSILSNSLYSDTNNNAAIDRFYFPVSGKQILALGKSHYYPGQEWLEAGVGHHTDLIFSGIKYGSGKWFPEIYTGVFYDLNTQLYLYSTNSIELIVSGGSQKIHDLPITPQEFKPIFVGSFYVDEWSRARSYELFTYKTLFTSINNSPTLIGISGSDPQIYNQTYNSVIWNNVDTSGKEFFVDRINNKLILNKTIYSGVSTVVPRTKWDNTKFQLPLVPVITITSGPNLYVNEYYVNLVNNSGTIKIHQGDNPTYPYPTEFIASVPYSRLASGLKIESAPSGKIWATSPTAFSGWPASGYALIDLGANAIYPIGYNDLIGTSGLNNVYLASGAINSAIIPRNGIIRQRYNNVSISGNQIITSGLPNNNYVAYYQRKSVPYLLDKPTGVLTILGASGAARIYAELSYERGLFATYEPSGATKTLIYSGLDLNPLLRGTNHGFLAASMYPIRPSKIELAFSQSIDINNKRTIYAGSDYLTIEAKVLDRYGSPANNAEVVLTFDNLNNVGYVDGVEPSVEQIKKVTDAGGIARFTYTPPDTIQGLGYFTDTISNTSGLTLPKPAPLGEFLDEDGEWSTLLYSVWSDDNYLDYNELSGLYTYETDGRFELVSQISGQLNGTNIWQPLRPVAALNQNGQILPTSAITSGVYKLVYPTNSLPINNNIEAFFISAEKEIKIGAAIKNGYGVAPTFPIKVKIPQFMTGEFYWGPIDDPKTSAFDSLSYLTINPFTNINLNESRVNYRSLGNVFRIIGTSTNILRNKFYINIDIAALNGTSAGQQELRKQFTFRNRFILEV